MGNHQLILQRPLRNGAAEIQATIAGYPDWKVRAVVEPTESGPVISSLTVQPAYPALESDLPAGGLPARAIRRINPGELVDLASDRAAADRAGVAELSARFASNDTVGDWLGAMAEMTASLAKPRKRAGRSGNGLVHYALWAARYVQKVDAGERHPIAALARDHRKELGRTQAKAETYIRDTITDARRRYQLLTNPGQGRAGGQLTVKAHRVLEGIANRQETSNG
jgi:hypothetical protein